MQMDVFYPMEQVYYIHDTCTRCLRALFCFGSILGQSDSCDLFHFIWWSSGVLHGTATIVWTRSREVTLKVLSSYQYVHLKIILTMLFLFYNSLYLKHDVVPYRYFSL